MSACMLSACANTSLVNMNTLISFASLLKLINKQRKSGQPCWFKEELSPHWVDPSCLLWRIMRVIFQGLEKRSIWNSTIPVLTPLYISLWGAKKNHPSCFGGERMKEERAHNNILDHFSYLQAPFGLIYMFCFIPKIRPLLFFFCLL